MAERVIYVISFLRYMNADSIRWMFFALGAITAIMAAAIIVDAHIQTNTRNFVTNHYNGCDEHKGVNFIEKIPDRSSYIIRCSDTTVKFLTKKEIKALTNNQL